MIVKVIDQYKQVSLVQWFDETGMPRRGYLPTKVVRGEFVSDDELDRAVPYGEPWEDLIELRATSEQLARNLRQAGIWTAEQLQKNPEKVRGVLMATYAVDYNALVKIAYGGK